VAKLRDTVEVKLLSEDKEVYVLAKSEGVKPPPADIARASHLCRTKSDQVAPNRTDFFSGRNPCPCLSIRR
jgi:hypothetical protein